MFLLCFISCSFIFNSFQYLLRVKILRESVCEAVNQQIPSVLIYSELELCVHLLLDD